jgi:hypothetical protein
VDSGGSDFILTNTTVSEYRVLLVFNLMSCGRSLCR